MIHCNSSRVTGFIKTIKTMTKTHHSTVCLCSLALFTSLPLMAGTDTTLAQPITPEASNAFTGELSVGYDNRYIFRGLWFGNDTVWGNLSISKEIAPKWTISANVFYTDVMDSDLDYSESNLGANIAYASDYGTFTFGGTYYKFHDGFGGNSLSGAAGQGDASELYLSYSHELFCGITGSFLAAYDLRVDGGYLEAGLGKTWSLSDSISLDTSATVGYGLSDYYSQKLSGDDPNDFTHVGLRVALPIQLAETVVLTPHVSAIFAGDARSAGDSTSIGDDEVYFGVSLSVSF